MFNLWLNATGKEVAELRKAARKKNLSLRRFIEHFAVRESIPKPDGMDERHKKKDVKHSAPRRRAS